MNYKSIRLVVLKMKYINHITLNSGHIRKTYSSEIEQGFYFKLMRIYKDIFKKEGTDIIDGYIAKGTNEPGNGVLITVFGPDGVPILTTGITKNENNTVWDLLHTTSMAPLKTSAASPPEVPFIADRLEIGAMIHMDALKWTGDFTRCMGWICLDPQAIR